MRWVRTGRGLLENNSTAGGQYPGLELRDSATQVYQLRRRGDIAIERLLFIKTPCERSEQDSKRYCDPRYHGMNVHQKSQASADILSPSMPQDHINYASEGSFRGFVI
nr:hypothetical protein CFP56_71233 [Quercus suber]